MRTFRKIAQSYNFFFIYASAREFFLKKTCIYKKKAVILHPLLKKSCFLSSVG